MNTVPLWNNREREREMMPMSFSISLCERSQLSWRGPMYRKSYKPERLQCNVCGFRVCFLFDIFFVQGLLFSKGKIENFLLEERRLEKRRGVCVNKYVFQMSHAPNPITLEGPASPDCSHLPFYWER